MRLKYSYVNRFAAENYDLKNISVRLAIQDKDFYTVSLCLSVCLCQFVSGSWLFGGFDIDLPYLAHWCMTMRRCVAHIHDPESTLTFDLKVKFIGFLTCFRVRLITFFFGLTLAAYHIWHKRILLPIQHWSLTLRAFIGFSHIFVSNP